MAICQRCRWRRHHADEAGLDGTRTTTRRHPETAALPPWRIRHGSHATAQFLGTFEGEDIETVKWRGLVAANIETTPGPKRGLTMSIATEIDLTAVRFGRAAATLIRYAGMEVAAFRYRTGVEALRISSPAGEVLLLPFKGQQIWDATFGGRRLTMQSMFDEPQATTDYLGTYGALLLHCGIAGMGAPGPDDSHPQHGELPNARFDTAILTTGVDAEGPLLAISGSCRQTRAFHYNYRFSSSVTLRPTRGTFDVSIAVDNLRSVPFDVMYLAHMNFRPIDGGRLFDTVGDDSRDIELRTAVPKGLVISPRHRRFVDAVRDDPQLHRQLLAGQPVEPELVLYLKCGSDPQGFAHSLQVHPDGSADFVSHRPADLPVGVRWISRIGDQDALGLMLPSTSQVDGYLREKANGRVVTLPAGGQFATRYLFGMLDAAEAGRLAAAIEATKRR